MPHLFAAAGYSVAGARRLWQETALSQIVAAFLVCLMLFALLGANGLEIAFLFIFFFCLVAVEALNTAIESIVDHLAPDWQVFARDAKDLGSLATMCLLAANAVFIVAVLARVLALIMKDNL
ncbi:diacylglycerol kinase [Ruegeria sp. WL0004]|uniref:Diacylglycerol kinase n=1 Tax=Ruegeria marisflavi TaxID=2984152 RepID=A0ABT2WWD8_9RHOB|nr:diacylglycerol kinase [Ruegeria sp. WL0004]MCU9840213.1 diacylglycerol kinase [Ruegeria sp. WL0004]